MEMPVMTPTMNPLEMSEDDEADDGEEGSLAPHAQESSGGHGDRILQRLIGLVRRKRKGPMNTWVLIIIMR